MTFIKILLLIVINAHASTGKVKLGKNGNASVSAKSHVEKKVQRFVIPTVQPGSDLKISNELTPEAITITKKSGSLKDTELPGAFGSDPELRDNFEGTGSGSGSSSAEESKEHATPKEFTDQITDVDTESKKQRHDETITQQENVSEAASNFGNNIPIVPGINPTSAFIANDGPGEVGEGSDYGTRINHKRKHNRKSKTHINKEKSGHHNLQSNKKKTVLLKTSNKTQNVKPKNASIEEPNQLNSVTASTTEKSFSSTTFKLDSEKTTVPAAKKTMLNQPSDDDFSINESDDYRIKNKLSVSRNDDDENNSEDRNIMENVKSKKAESHIKKPDNNIVKYDGDNTDDDDNDEMTSRKNNTLPTKKMTKASTKKHLENYINKTRTSTSRMHWNSTRARPKNTYIASKSTPGQRRGTDLYNTIQRIQEQIKEVESEADIKRKIINQTETRKDKKLRKEVNSVMKKIEDDLLKYRQKSQLPSKVKTYRYYNDDNKISENLNNVSVPTYQENIPFEPYEDTDNKSMEEAYRDYLNRTKEEQKKPIKNFIYSKVKGESSDATELPSELTNSSVDAFPQGIAGGPEGFECPWPCLWTCHSYCPKECCNNPYRCKPICREFCTPYCTDKCCAPGARRLPKLKLQFQSVAETGYDMEKLKKQKHEIENKIKVIEKAQEYASQLFGLPATCPLFCNRICAPALCKRECCRPLVNTLSSLLNPINKKLSELQESKPMVSEPVPASRNYPQLLVTPAPQQQPHANNVIPVEKASSSLTPHFALDEVPLKKLPPNLIPATKQLSVVNVPYYADKKQIAQSIQLAVPDSQLNIASVAVPAGNVAAPAETLALPAVNAAVPAQYLPLRKSVPPILNRLRSDEELLRKALETSPYSTQNIAANSRQDNTAATIPVVQDTLSQFQSPQSSPLAAAPSSVNNLPLASSLQSMEPISHLAPETKAYYSSVYSPTEASESPLDADYCPPICRTSCIEQCPNECCPNGGRQRSTIG